MTGQLPPLPPGYRLEQPQQGSIPPLPPGYSLETNSVTSRPGVPWPSVDMKSSFLGTLEGGPTDIPASGSKVPRSIQNAPDETGEAIAGLTAAGTAGTALGASGETAAGAATLRALTPIAKKYGIKALEGAGLAYGWHLYRELKNVFEGSE